MVIISKSLLARRVVSVYWYLRNGDGTAMDFFSNVIATDENYIYNYCSLISYYFYQHRKLMKYHCVSRLHTYIVILVNCLTLDFYVNYDEFFWFLLLLSM